MNQDPHYIKGMLERLKDLDELTKTMQEKFEGEGSRNRFAWLFMPFLKALYIRKEHTDVVMQKILNFASAPPVIALFGALGFLSFITAVESALLTPYPYLLIGLALYLYSAMEIFFRQLDFKDKLFDLYAFKAIHPSLYQAFQSFSGTAPFSFNSLHETIRTILEREHLTGIEAYNELKAVYEKLEAITEERNQMMNDVEYSESNMANLLTVYEHALKLVQAAAAKRVSKDVLYLYTDYSLFEKRGDLLVLQESHHTYDIPREISLTDEAVQHWAVVKACHAKEDADLIQLDISHRLVSLAIKIKVEQTIYLYSFHFAQREIDHLIDMIMREELHTLLYHSILLYHKEKEG
ncbi:hypothetical protein [Jeotgalibacillus proteolyticus]|uniref:Uncharacterized protein n=1 Tax=Jeotgalibacillus proteolyticus TaxID=2082395 RepID=A0A2S5GDA4_9BACL|nr:hypothetical protein [Jeotgalibacillus proteolyticus]PPA70969.1 hypothetical protein C4B60_09300 [Jeotgalibacillus proteolyticus]